MITSRPFESTWLKIFASGSRGAGAGAAAVVGRGARCCGTIRAERLEGDSKVTRSKRTSKLRFTDNSIMLELLLDAGKRLSCREKIVQEALFYRFFVTIDRAF